MADGNHCSFCFGPASDNCYAEHLLDRTNRISSPDLADALFSSIFPLLAFDPTPSDDELKPMDSQSDDDRDDETRAVIFIDESSNQNEAASTNLDPVSSGSHRNDPSSSLSQPATTQSTAQPDRRAPRLKFRGPRRPLGTKSGTEMTPEAKRKHEDQVTECQENAYAAFDDIEKAKDQLMLTRKTTREWTEAIASGRNLIMRLDKEKSRGDLDVKIVRTWVKKLEKVSTKVHMNISAGKLWRS